MQIQIKKDLELRRLALGKHQIVIKKCEIEIIPVLFITPTIRQSSLD